MIRVTIELWPGGDASTPRTLGTIDIINTGDHPQHPSKGNYHSRFWASNGRRTGREATVTDHPRNGLPVFVLLRKILEKAGY
jgi:hypothetical protein